MMGGFDMQDVFSRVLSIVGALAFVVATMGVPGVARADSDDAVDQRASVTLSTLNLAKPILSDETVSFGPEFEVFGEFNLADTFGVGPVLAYGHATSRTTEGPIGFDPIRIGLQGLWYPVGDFAHGMQLGVHTDYTHVWGGGESDGIRVQATAGGPSVAGLVGYKLVAGPGFTLMTQLGGGAQFLTASGSAQADDGTERDAESSAVAPKILFNINLGWSF
jgi:hypothetical protein